MVKITVVGMDRAGFAKSVEVQDGTTVGEVASKAIEEIEDKDEEGYRTIRNGQPCAEEEVVKEGDIIVIVSKRIRGDGPRGLALRDVIKGHPKTDSGLVTWIYWEGYVKGYRDKSEGKEFDTEE